MRNQKQIRRNQHSKVNPTLKINGRRFINTRKTTFSFYLYQAVKQHKHIRKEKLSIKTTSI